MHFVSRSDCGRYCESTTSAAGVSGRTSPTTRSPSREQDARCGAPGPLPSTSRDRSGRHRGHADHVELRRVGRRELGRKQRRVAALRVTEDGGLVARSLRRRSAHGRCRAPLALRSRRRDTDAVRGAEPRVVGEHDDRSRVEELGELGDLTRRRRDSSDGAHRDATPLVPWAQATTGRPPSGTAPVGANTTPETAIGVPFGSVDAYSTRRGRAGRRAVDRFRAQDGAGRIVGPGPAACRTRWLRRLLVALYQHPRAVTEDHADDAASRTNPFDCARSLQGSSR